MAQPETSEKIYRIDEHVICAISGLTSDANVLVSFLRNNALTHRADFQEGQHLDQLLKRVCDLKQGYTQYGGQRPFGVALLYAGVDDRNGLQLYHSDPTGNFASWKAKAIGKNFEDATAALVDGVKDNLSLAEGKILAVKTFRKILDLNDDIDTQLQINIISKVEGKMAVKMQKMSADEIIEINKTLVAEGEKE